MPFWREIVRNQKGKSKKSIKKSWRLIIRLYFSRFLVFSNDSNMFPTVF
jgi:hypothetical protein